MNPYTFAGYNAVMAFHLLNKTHAGPHSLFQLAVVPLILLYSLLTSCTGGSEVELSAAVPNPTVLPELADLPRAASAAALERRIAGGSEFIAEVAAANVTASTALSADFAATSADSLDGYAYAIYGLQFESTSVPATLHVTWDDAALPTPGSYWIGVSNFETGRWEWLPQGGGPAYQLGSWEPYTDLAGTLFIAVIVGGDTTANLQWLRAGNNAPPVILLDPGELPLKAPAEITFDASSSTDLDGMIASVEWDEYGDGVFDLEGEELTLTKQYFIGGPYQLSLKLTDNEGAASQLDYAFELDEHAPWWCWGGERRNRRHANFTGPMSEPTESEWQYEFDSQGSSIMLLADDGTVYANELNALGLHSFTSEGDYNWNMPNRLATVLGPSGELYSGYIEEEEQSIAVAYNPDQSVKWDEELTGNIGNCLGIGIDGSVFYAAGNGNLFALSPDDGSVRWDYPLGEGYGRCSSVAIGLHGEIYFRNGALISQSQGNLVALDWQGNYMWDTSVGGAALPLVGDDGTVYVNADSRLQAHDPLTGEEKWDYPVSGSDIYPLAHGYDLGEERIYFGSENSNFYCIKSDGSLGWTFEGAPTKNPLVGGNNRIYIEAGKTMYCLRPNKNIEWSAEIAWSDNGTESCLPCAIGNDGTLYLMHAEYYGPMAFKD